MNNICIGVAAVVGMVGAMAASTFAKDVGAAPAATLAEEISREQTPLVEGYAAKHPRLLYGAQDIPLLKAKAQTQEKLWSAVLASARRMGDTAPDGETIRNGKTYWRSEGMQSGALAYVVTGDKVHLDRATRWMLAHCKEDVWGTGYRSNLDLQASWYLYHIAIAYDALYNDLAPADRDAIRAGLVSHARAIYQSLAPADAKVFTYDQNHLYIPTVALAAGALALLDETPEAAEWLKRAQAIMERCRYVMGDDGWYFEGPGYWYYALHWHARYADMMGRATGRNYYELPALKECWRFALFTMLPTAPGVFDVGDTITWKNDRRGDFGWVNYTMLWRLAGATKVGAARTVADALYARAPERDYPAAAFLWFDPAVQPAPLEAIKPYHYFADHGYVAWRSGWGKDDMACLIRLGPPEGHAATTKMAQMADWRMNAGHVHADIGNFWMYAKGTYLATDTGYTAEKWTRDQNTILIDGVGQAMDGAYHNERGYPPDKLAQVRLDGVHLSDACAFASGEYGAAYPQAKVGVVSLRRSWVTTKRWMLVVDDLKGEGEHKLTWICHSDEPFVKEGEALIARQPQASLAVVPVRVPGQGEMDVKLEPAMVMAGTAPGAGKLQQRGFQVMRTMATPARSQRLIHLLAPLEADEKPPVVEAHVAERGGVSLTLKWPGRASETVVVDGSWMAPSAGRSALPVMITSAAP